MNTPDPLARIRLQATPQDRPLPGRADEQVRNDAGGYVFASDLWTRVEDFLILGTTGGTYYMGETQRTETNADVVAHAIAEDGPRVVDLLTGISTARPPRAARQRPALFTLAACYAIGDAATRQAVKAALPSVARTTDHLAMFFGYCKQLGGKPTARGFAPRTGRSLRTALASWFLRDSADDVAFRACKAMQRKTPQGESFHLRDVLRLAHPRVDSPARAALIGWIAGNVSDEHARAVLPAVDRFLTAKAVTTPAEAVRVITDKRVPWEFLPDAMLREPSVWEALIDTIGMTALLRNLARMTASGALSPFADATRRVIARLTNAEALATARVHPMDVWLAMRVYTSGRAQPALAAPIRYWTPVAAVADALEETWDLSFDHLPPSGRRLLIAVDSSASMTWLDRLTVGGSPIGSAYEAACAMAITLARIERGTSHVIDVDTRVHPSKITARTNLREVASWRPSGGGTDLALPFLYAEREKLDADGIVIFTDNVTWAGQHHPSQALASYRATVSARARVMVASMTANGYTIADPRDAGVLQMTGLDASLPLAINQWMRQEQR
ncbi:TROVE domain-containing protein [Nonomuraea sp. KM90]|uniref:TROVE domain-containing protein n=1 Tax=Nonomuraea sp. KM90 TaxID=3457428 RepID=UPI003FCEB50D